MTALSQRTTDEGSRGLQRPDAPARGCGWESAGVVACRLLTLWQTWAPCRGGKRTGRSGQWKGGSNMVKTIQGTLTPYEPTEVAVMTVVSRSIKRLSRGAPDLSRSSATRHRGKREVEGKWEITIT